MLRQTGILLRIDGILRVEYSLGGTIKEMMEAEMDDHLGYEKSQRSDSDDYRNGYKEKDNV